MKIKYPLDIPQLINIAGSKHICNIELKRTTEINLLYKKYRETIANNSKFDLIKYIFNKDLNKLKPSDWVIKLNDFPYDTEKDIIHYVLWLPSIDYTEKSIQKIIDSEFSDYKNVVWFTNVPKLRSIKNIYHAHVFVK